MNSMAARPNKRMTGLVLALALGQAVAAAPAQAASGSTSGSPALALAAVVSAHFTVVGPYERRALARLFSGHTVGSFPPGRKISVAVDSIMCRISNVDLTARSCELMFKGGKRSLTGRDANELYATLAFAGIMAEGAAGSMIQSIMKLDCTIDPNMIKQKDGGGADCMFETQ